MSDPIRRSSAPKRFSATVPREYRADIPLRAKSVCLAERPRSQYGPIRKVEPQHPNFAVELYKNRPELETKRRLSKPSSVYVKQQKRKAVEKIPFSVAVQTLSIPMTYADAPKPRHSTSKPRQLCNERIDMYRTNTCNPSKQVTDNKRLCQSAGCGKETENKLLLQISEAEQVSDFERILNSNAILWERARRHVWRRSVQPQPSAAVLPRPRSSYSLSAVSQAYHYLYQQHEESLKPLIEHYRKTVAERQSSWPENQESGWYENLQYLSEFYEDDPVLQQEIENINDQIIEEEIKSLDKPEEVPERNKNFNVNLADLFDLRVSGEGCSPAQWHDELGPDVEKGAEIDVEGEKEWLSPIMNENSDDRQNNDKIDLNVDSLAQNLGSVQIDSDGKVPTITFSNCCDGYVKSSPVNNTGVDIHLAVPSIDSGESRPPIM